MLMHEPSEYECPFCNIQKSEELKAKEVLLESEHSICLLDLRGNIGSGPTLLVASKAHYENLYELPDHILSDAFSLAKQVAIRMRALFDINGTTIWQHNEPSGNQDVWHFHLHVKGRVDGDALYNKTSFNLLAKEREEIALIFLSDQ